MTESVTEDSLDMKKENIISITVNGNKIPAKKGETILEACEREGIYVPTLCHYQNLENVGACRMCLVEIDGNRLETACTTPAQDGMEIEVNTDELWDLRRNILELMFSAENHYCMYCEMEGNCELEWMFRRAGMDNVRYTNSYPEKDFDGSNEHIAIDINRCILCGRCIRVCQEIVANDTLDFGNRGKETKVIADNDVPLGESSCISCGACVQVCPTGSIFDKHSAYKGDEIQSDSTESYCAECSIGCGIDVFHRSNNLVRIEGDESEESGGQLCEKGRFKTVTDTRRRIQNPFLNKDGEKQEITVEEAVKQVKEILANSQNISSIASDRLPTETVELFQRVMKGYDAEFTLPGAERHELEKEVLRDLDQFIPHIDKNVCMNNIYQILEADQVIVYDTSIVDSHPVLSSYIRRASKNGAKLMTIDPYGDKFRGYSDVTLSIGSPRAQLTEFVMEVLQEEVDSIEELSTTHLGGVNVHSDDVMTMASYLEGENDTIIVMGPGVDDKKSMRNILGLSVLTDNCIISLNRISNQDLKKFDSNTGINESETAYLFASDDREDNLGEMKELADNSDKVIVQAARESELTEKADIVLPALTWSEREGSFVDINGDLKEINRITEPRISIESDKELVRELI